MQLPTENGYENVAILCTNASKNEESKRHARELRSKRMVDPLATRWERILQCDDDGLLWKAINWKGQFNPEETEKVQPSESASIDHLKRSLNHSGQIIQTDLTDYCGSIPLLDKNIDASEADQAK